MRSLDVMDDALAVLTGLREPRASQLPKCRPFEFECEVNVEPYKGLVLDGFINCDIEAQDDEFWISKQKLKIKDMKGNDIDIDWDVLDSDLAEQIEDQVVQKYATRMAA